MKIDRVFLDTNVLISGLLFRGNEALLLELADQGLVRLVLSTTCIEEARATFQNKFLARSSVLEDFLTHAEYEMAFEPTESDVESALLLVRDPNDAPILASILLTKPDIALTGDKDLLTEEVKKIAPVCRCSDYLRSLTSDNR
jgi:putative PIN family toxin of toxin-antitoxin system